MGSKYRNGWIIPLLTILAFQLAKDASAATQVIDQSLFITGGGNLSNEINPFFIVSAQTFRAGISGDLTEADVYMNRDSLVVSPVLATIRPVDVNGRPTSSILSSQTVAASVVNNGTEPPGLSPDWVPFVFSSPAHVNAGTSYALAIRINDTDPGAFLNWIGNTNDLYPNGSLYNSTDGITFNQVSPTYDVDFRTYVTAVPEPSSSLLFVTVCAFGIGCRRFCRT